MMLTRYREVWFFWRRHLAAILVIVLPVALLEAGLRLWLGEPLTFAEDGALRINGYAASAILVTRSMLEARLLILFARSLGESAAGPAPWALTLQLLPLVILTNLLMFVLVGIGFTLLILPGVWLFVRLIFSTCLVVLEQRNPVDALLRSFRLSAGPVQWEIFPLWLLMVMVLQLPLLVLSGLLSTLNLSDQVLGLALLVPTLLLNSLPLVLVFRYFQLLKDARGC